MTPEMKKTLAAVLGKYELAFVCGNCKQVIVSRPVPEILDLDDGTAQSFGMTIVPEVLGHRCAQ